MIRMMIAGLIGLLAIGSMAAAPPAPKKKAVLVGVDFYNHTDLNQPKPLQYAEKDVTDLKVVLEKSGYQVDLLTGENATKAAILKTLKEAKDEANATGVLLIGFAGHGMQPEKSDEAYFCPFNTKQRDRPQNGEDPWDYGSMVPLGDVLATMKASSAGSRVLMMDACRNDPVAGRGRGVGTNLKISDIPKTAVILSCSQGQKSFEDKAWGGGHGVFFHHVLTGLGGKESSVLAGGKVDLDQLWIYLKNTVPEQVKTVAYDSLSRTGPNQKPFRLVNGDVDLMISTAEERDFEIYKGVKMRFCWIPKGKATLGSPAKENDRKGDENEHEFETNGFWLGKYEVTQREYEGVTGKNPSHFKGAKLPVEQVTWDECQKFIEKCGVKGMKLKLPHEDEWEYACRGGKGNKQAFYWGDVLNGDKVNCDGNYPYGTPAKGNFKKKTTEVGSYEKEAMHPWGLCDMSGNVAEWCENSHTIGGSVRVLRGGSWDDSAWSSRSAHRGGDTPSSRLNIFGFRLSLVP